MSLEAFSRLIDFGPFRRFVERKQTAIERIDPERIFVENIRAVFGLPHRVARFLLDVATREGSLERKIGVLCPYDRHIVKSFPDDSERKAPETVHCFVCEAAGRDDSDHVPSEMERLVFYRLVHSEHGQGTG